MFQEKPEVVVEKIVRNKRKCVTIIKGLDMFGMCTVVIHRVFWFLIETKELPRFTFRNQIE